MKRSTFTKFLFLLWVILWIMAFIFIPSRVDFIHGGTFGSFEDFPQNLERFNLTAAMTDVLFSFSAVSLLTLVYLTLGSGIFRLLTKNFFFDEKISISNWLGLACTSFVLGHALFSFIFILLGDKHLLETKYIWTVLLGGTLAGISSLIILYKKIPASANNRITTLWNQAKQKIILTLTAVILLLGLFYSATRLSYDAVAFYFSDEKLTSMTGQIDYFQNDSYIASSFQTGITYAVIISLAGDQAARMYSWVNGLVIILFLLAIGARLGLSRRARLLSVVLLLTSTAFVDLTGDGKIDIISTTPAIASIYWAIISITRKDKAIALLIGILAGISIVSRPFNAFLVCMFIGIYYTISFFSSENKTERLKIAHMVIFIGLGTIIPGISHLIVNQLILGDPLSFLHNVQVTNASNWQWTFDKDNLWIIRLLYPFALTIINIPQSNGNISPLFVAFLPALLSKNIMVKFKEKPQLSRIVITAIITLFLWNTILFTVFEIRYVLFLWIILYIALAMVMEEIIFGADKFRGKFTEFTVILVLLFAGIRMIYIIIDTYSPVDKTNTPHCTDHDLCAILDPINESANAGERVFTLSAFRYYLRPDLLACSSKHDDYQKLQQLANTDPNQFWSELHRLGFQYITFEPRYSKIHLGFNISLENENIPEWMELKPLLTLPAEYASYKIITRNPPVTTQKTCTQNLAGQWETIVTTD